MVWPKSFQLVSLLQLPQFLLDAVEEVCALKATAAAVQTHDYGVEGADQHRGPVHLKLLRHHLTTGGAVPTRAKQTCQNQTIKQMPQNNVMFHWVNDTMKYPGHISPQHQKKWWK